MGENAQKRICLVVTDLHKGGMERVMSELANFFSTKVNTEVNIILLTNRSDIFYKISSNVAIHEPGFTFNNSIRTLSTIRTLFYLRKTIRKVKPDAILSFGETYNSFVLLSTLFLNIKVFVSDRSKPDKSWGFFQEKLRKMLYPLASGIISQTNYSRDFLLKETGHRNIKVIPNPVRTVDKVIQERRNVILNVGRLIKSKRIDLLLNIFSKCENNGWMLWIVGEDEKKEKDILIKLSRELNILDKVTFWGKQEDMDKFYGAAKIFAFSSESEGLPNVLMEAMAAGLACISFDCIAGPRDLITDDENGYLVKMYDSKEYIFKLNLLLQNPELRKRFSDNAQKKTEEFDIKIIGDKFYNFMLS
jgi:GalNAc-alpha-(1->4)-GalNAc-alpha-(1->3)-diNAcBac-PP-undecaprenol alpha-1,4-N-acetyl-D-galactosaminyltransferase